MMRRAFLAAAMLGLARPAVGHNNPTMKETALLEVEVTPAAAGAANSAPFALDPPKRTAELVWRCVEPAPPGLRFALAQDGKVVAADLADGATTRMFKGQGYTITGVQGTDRPFRLAVAANVAEWQRSS